MIAVISDSHIPSRAKKIPEKFLEVVKEADKVVHCGDFVTKETYDMLEQKSKEFIAVKGNCDRFHLPNSETFNIDDFSVGAYHGTGINPRGHHPTLLRIADDLEVDVLIHGHTHEQETVKKQENLLLNPGSCTGVGGGSSTDGKPEMLTFEVEASQVKVELLEFDEGEVKKVEEIFEL
ncbi:MAG: metallophosphoesterase [Nanohaloarchaea archaeon]|nr:metallophosphoesterase [Candidatus Nanohaloarchaea archaeon]